MLPEPEEELEALRGAYDMKRAECAQLRVELERVTEERDRWARRMRELENRARHASEVLSGQFAPPDVDEVRRVRGLEPLAPWEIKGR